MIQLSFNASNPELAQAFLSKLIDNYLRKHIAIHSDLGVSDFLSRQTDQMRTRLAETEEQLRSLLNSAGVISVADAKISVARRIDLLKQGIQEAEVSLATAQARLDLTRGPNRCHGGWYQRVDADLNGNPVEGDQCGNVG